MNDDADPHVLQRFVEAQAPVYETVRHELARGAKASHWMWFVFPQLAALGRSATAQRFGLAGRDDAIAYDAHPLLGARLRECTRLALDVAGRSAREVFGTPDDLKFRSSMTLFAAVAPHEPAYAAALAHYFDDRPDPLTTELLR